jgi:hypothetical protein
MTKLAKFKNHEPIEGLLLEYDKCVENEKYKSFFTKLNKGEYDHYFSDKNLIYEPSGKEIISCDELVVLKLPAASIAFYESIGNINKEEAIDKRLWTYLSLGPFRNYSIGQSKILTSDSKDMKGQIIKRFFYEGNGMLVNELNYISRLWWYSENTICDNDIDKYKYTRIMLNDTQVTFDLMERYEFASNKELVHAYLDFLNDKLKKDGIPIAKVSKGIAPILLNHIKSFDIQFFLKEEIKGLLNEFYDFAIKNKRI